MSRRATVTSAHGLDAGPDGPSPGSGMRRGDAARVYIVSVWHSSAPRAALRISVRPVEEEAAHEFVAVRDIAHFFAAETTAAPPDDAPACGRPRQTQEAE